MKNYDINKEVTKFPATNALLYTFYILGIPSLLLGWVELPRWRSLTVGLNITLILAIGIVQQLESRKLLSEKIQIGSKRILLLLFQALTLGVILLQLWTDLPWHFRLRLFVVLPISIPGTLILKQQLKNR